MKCSLTTISCICSTSGPTSAAYVYLKSSEQKLTEAGVGEGDNTGAKIILQIARQYCLIFVFNIMIILLIYY